MITRSWVQSEIEHAMMGPSTRETVYDLSALITVMHYLDEQEADTKAASMPPEAPTPESEDARKKREAIILTSHSADLDTIPTITQIYDALDAVQVDTVEDREKMEDARTWAQILKGGV